MVGVHGHHNDHDPVLGQPSPVPEHDLADVADPQAVHERHPGLDPVHDPDLLADLHHVAVLRDHGVVGGDPDLAGQPDVVVEVAALAVHRDEPPRAHQVEDGLQLVGGGVPGHVDGGDGDMEDVGPGPVQPVRHAVDGRLVAGDQRARQHHGVAGLELHPLVLARRHQAEGGEWLALGARRDHDDFRRVQVLELLDVDDVAVVELQMAQPPRRRHALVHGAPQERDLSSALARGVRGLLDAVDVAGEARDHNELPGVAHDLREHGPDGPLGGDDTEVLGVRGIAQEQVDAAGPLLGEGLEVGRPVVKRRLIELEVARVQNRAELRVDGHGHAVGDGVGHAEEPHRERPHLLARPRLDHVEFGAVADLVLLELPLQEGEGEPGPVDGDLELAKQVRDRADVVLVAVREHHGLQLVRVLPEELEVRQNQVDARQLRARERQAAVDDEDAPVELEAGHVPPDLAHSPEENEAR